MVEEKKEKKARAKKTVEKTTEKAVEKKAVEKKSGEKMSKKAQEKTSTANVSDYGLILSPMITEKTSMVGGAGNRVVFKVDRRATKTEIKAAIERVFKVTVEDVNTVNYLGKPKRTSRSEGRRTAYKKAYVTLQEGQTINVIEGL